MKKSVIISLLMFLSITASAQIQVVKKYPAIVELASVRMGILQFNLDDGDYYLRIRTTSEVDDPIIVHLGKSMESAKRSIFDIIDLMNELKKGESAVFTTEDGEFRYTLYKADKLIARFLDKTKVGEHYILASELQTLTEKVY